MNRTATISIRHFALLFSLVALSGCAQHVQQYRQHVFARHYVPGRSALEPYAVGQMCGTEQPMFFGYHATCWNQWPEGWMGCPDGMANQSFIEHVVPPAGMQPPAAPMTHGMEPTTPMPAEGTMPPTPPMGMPPMDTDGATSPAEGGAKPMPPMAQPSPSDDPPADTSRLDIPGPPSVGSAAPNSPTMAPTAVLPPTRLPLPLNDETVAKRIITRLKELKDSGEIKKFSIELSVLDREARLIGRVASDEQRDAVLTAVGDVPGVNRVLDELTVASAPTTDETSTDSAPLAEALPNSWKPTRDADDADSEEDGDDTAEEASELAATPQIQAEPTEEALDADAAPAAELLPDTLFSGPPEVASTSEPAATQSDEPTPSVSAEPIAEVTPEAAPVAVEPAPAVAASEIPAAPVALPLDIGLPSVAAESIGPESTDGETAENDSEKSAEPQVENDGKLPVVPVKQIPALSPVPAKTDDSDPVAATLPPIIRKPTAAPAVGSALPPVFKRNIGGLPPVIRRQPTGTETAAAASSLVQPSLPPVIRKATHSGLGRRRLR